MPIESGDISRRGKEHVHLADSLTRKDESVKDKTMDVAASTFASQSKTSPRPSKRKPKVILSKEPLVSEQFSRKVARRAEKDRGRLNERQIKFVQKQMKKNLAGKNLEAIRSLRHEVVENIHKFDPYSIDYQILQTQFELIDQEITLKEAKEIKGWQNASVRQFFEDNCLGCLDQADAEETIEGCGPGIWLLRRNTEDLYVFTLVNESGNIKHLIVDHRAIPHVRELLKQFPYSMQIKGLVHDQRNHGRLFLKEAEGLLEGRPVGTWMLSQPSEQKGHPTVSRVEKDGSVLHHNVPPHLVGRSMIEDEESAFEPFEVLKNEFGYEPGKFLAPEGLKPGILAKLMRTSERIQKIFGDGDDTKSLGMFYYSEFIDERHGYSLDLEPWWKEWHRDPSINISFNEWIRKVRSGLWPLGEDFQADRSIEEVREVQYFDEMERQQYELEFREGKLFVKGSDDPLHCDEGQSVIFIQSPDGTLYGGLYERGVIHHSSFLSGRPVIAAGELILTHGKVVGVSDKSGHYQTTSGMFCQGLTSIEDLGVDLSGVLVDRYYQGKFIPDFRTVDQILEDHRLLMEFASNHAIPDVDYREAAKWIKGSPPGNWNLTYSDDDCDYIINIVLNSGKVRTLFLSDIKQSSDMVIALLRQKRGQDLMALPPFFGMTEETREKLKILKVTPFPVSNNRGLILEYLKTKPEGAWLVYESPTQGHEVLVNRRGKFCSYPLVKRSKKRFRQFRKENALTYNWLAKHELQRLSRQKKFNRLDVKPFPAEYTKDQIDGLLMEEPSGTWLIHKNDANSYDIVMVADDEIQRYELDTQLERDFEKLMPEGKITFSSEIVSEHPPENESDETSLSLSESMPAETPERVREGVENLIALLSDQELFYQERTALKKQVALSLAYLEQFGEEKRAEAMETSKTLYILPKEILESLGESIKDRKIGKGQEAFYKVAHIQVNPDGSVFIIPKHPALALGEGAYKKVRLAVELSDDFKPKQLVAFASLALNNEKDLEKLDQEVEFIKSYLEEEARLSDEDVPLSVRMTAYDQLKLYDIQMSKGRDQARQNYRCLTPIVETYHLRTLPVRRFLKFLQGW